MQVLKLPQLVNLEKGQTVTYLPKGKGGAMFGRGPVKGVIEYIRRVSKDSLNIMITVKGHNIIASTSDYGDNWVLISEENR